MYAITTMLSDTACQRVFRLWELIASECSMDGLKILPFPHFSWLGCDDLQTEDINKKLSHLACETIEFSVKTTGLGIFSGEKPILYIPVIKNYSLLDLQNKVWKTTISLLDKPNLYYHPDVWMPHITIAMIEKTNDHVICAINKLITQSLDMTITVDHFELDFYDGENLGCVSKFPFCRSST